MEILIISYIVSVIICCYIQYKDEEVHTIRDFINEETIILIFVPFLNTLLLMVLLLKEILDRLNISERWNRFLNIRIKK